MAATKQAGKTEETGEAVAPGNGKSRKGMPAYTNQKVSTLPDEAPATRALFYHKLLSEGPMRDPGEWYEIAHFQTSSGAQTVAKDLKEKRRPIPEGEWEIVARRVQNPDNPSGPQHSKLFARFVGED